MLGNIGDGAAILATQAQALDHPQAKEKECGGQTDQLVGRDRPDRSGAQSHSAERNKERILAANPVAHPSEKERPQWTDQENPAVNSAIVLSRAATGWDCSKNLTDRTAAKLPKISKSYPFDDVSYRRSDNHAAEIARDLNCHMCLLLFQGLASIFQRFVFSRSKIHARRELRVASATPGLRGTLNHPRRAPTAFGTASHRCLRPIYQRAKAVKAV